MYGKNRMENKRGNSILGEVVFHVLINMSSIVKWLLRFYRVTTGDSFADVRAGIFSDRQI